MALSYSFHISNSKNAIHTSLQLSRRLQHNLRSYSKQKLNDKAYDRQKNFVLLGPTSASKAFEKFKNFYSDTFDEAVNEYNSTKKKTRDKIENYFDHISNSKKSELATEIIIQVGDMEFWKTKSYDEQKQMNKIFQSQIQKLQKELPNFKILSVVVHYDEASPHLQILGVPIGYYDKGLKVRTTKSKVFSRESLESLQALMREDIERQMQEIYGHDINLKAKEKGRNYDQTCPEYKKFREQIKQERKQFEDELKQDKLKHKRFLDQQQEEFNKSLEKQAKQFNDELKQKQEQAKKNIEKEEQAKEKAKIERIQEEQTRDIIRADIKQFTNTDKWLSIQSLKNIDNSKEIKKPILSSTQKVELSIENYNNLFKMAKDNSSKIEHWNNKSNELEKQNKKLQDENRELKNQNKSLEKDNKYYKKLQYIMNFYSKLNTSFKQLLNLFTEKLKDIEFDTVADYKKADKIMQENFNLDNNKDFER